MIPCKRNYFSNYMITSYYRQSACAGHFYEKEQRAATFSRFINISACSRDPIMIKYAQLRAETIKNENE